MGGCVRIPSLNLRTPSPSREVQALAVRGKRIETVTLESLHLKEGRKAAREPVIEFAPNSYNSDEAWFLLARYASPSLQQKE